MLYLEVIQYSKSIKNFTTQLYWNRNHVGSVFQLEIHTLYYRKLYLIRLHHVHRSLVSHTILMGNHNIVSPGRGYSHAKVLPTRVYGTLACILNTLPHIANFAPALDTQSPILASDASQTY